MIIVRATLTTRSTHSQQARLLSILRRAAGPHTKLLLVDNLLPYACVDEKADIGSSSQGAVRSLVPEGSPLLPNLGRASANGYILDRYLGEYALHCMAGVCRKLTGCTLDARPLRCKGTHVSGDGRAHAIRGMEDHGRETRGRLAVGVYDCRAGVTSQNRVYRLQRAG